MNPRRIATALRELADAFEEADGAEPRYIQETGNRQRYQRPRCVSNA